MVVHTNTICPFPYTTPLGVNATTPADCTVTYGEALGAGHIILQIFLLTTGSIGCLIFAWRLHALWVYCKLKHSSYVEHPMFIHLALCFSFNAFMIAGSADVFGFWGLMPIEAYAILDEFCATLAITNGVLTLRFLHKMARGNHQRSKEIAQIITRITIGAVILNFFGFAIVSVIDQAHYKLYDGLKTVFGFIILTFFNLATTYFAIMIHRVLKDALNIAADRKGAEFQIQTLKTKHLRFTIVVFLAALACLVNGIVSLSASDLSWSMPLAEMPDPAQIGLRSVYMLNTYLTIYIFNVPKIGVDSTSNQNSPAVSPTAGSSKTNQLAAAHSPSNPSMPLSTPSVVNSGTA